jgi:membrane protease YdiL (CAAX protease family)
MSAVLLWVGVTFAFMMVPAVAGFFILLALAGGEEPPVDRLASLQFGLLVPTILVLWVAFSRRIRREQISLSDLGYSFTWKAGVIGIACGICMIGLDFVTGSIDERIFGPTSGRLMAMVAAAPMPGILALLIGNGLLVPLVEELAWRGYIQSRLALGWGPRAALVATALLFAAKHMVTDASLNRTVTLVVGSLALGVIRDRWGTFPSTLTHFLENFTFTTALVFEALTR